MEIEPQERFYYKQYDIEYQVEGPDSSVKKSDRLKLNLYFDPHQRDNENMEIDIALKSQKDALEEIKQKGLPLDDDETIKKAYSYFTVEYDPQTRVLLTYERNDKKIEKARETVRKRQDWQAVHSVRITDHRMLSAVHQEVEDVRHLQIKCRCPGRNARNPLCRASGCSCFYHPFCREAGQYLRGIRIQNP